MTASHGRIFGQYFCAQHPPRRGHHYPGRPGDGCRLLPALSENPDLGQELGTRHRAALGITEQSDAISIVVSEETGTISVAQEGKLRRYLDESSLKEYLENNYKKEPLNFSNLLHWRTTDG